MFIASIKRLTNETHTVWIGKVLDSGVSVFYKEYIGDIKQSIDSMSLYCVKTSELHVCDAKN